MGISFTAIDIKLATVRSTSICRIDLLRVVNDRCTGTLSLLVQPPNNYYWQQCSQSHHVYPTLTENAPKFHLLWLKIAPFIVGQDVVAPSETTFNALQQTLHFYHLAMPKFNPISIQDIFKNNFETLCIMHNIAYSPGGVLDGARACGDLYDLSLI